MFKRYIKKIVIGLVEGKPLPEPESSPYKKTT